MTNLIRLHEALRTKGYEHSAYLAFNISDPKPRNIHKASVKDRLVHYAIYRILYPYFDKRFIHDSYSCRIGKGTHKAIRQFKKYFYKVSKNNTRTCWVLKCDVRKFFASIDHTMLVRILEWHIKDTDTVWLLNRIIKSFDSGTPGKGLPLGNLTSQLLVNIYMNEFDQFVKHELKMKFYVRYADDFVFLHHDRQELGMLLPKIHEYLQTNLKLSLHPDKVFIATFSSGVDFLGWVHFPDHHVLRTATLRRMKKNIFLTDRHPATLASYRGLLSHGNTYKIRRDLML
ncbi:hypothetical protein BH11PAT3_BH11PAT3_2730 [soil metagenome]